MKKIPQFILSFIIILLINSQNSTVYGKDIIRIGYETNYAMVKTPEVRGYTGYGAEYLNKLIEYTSKEYQIEFVECSLEDGLYLLRIGMLNAFAPAIKKEEREALFYFSDFSLGRDIRFLSSTKPDYIPSGDYSELINAKILVQKGDPILADLEIFLEEHNISADIEEAIIDDYAKVYEEQKYDFVLASSLLMSDAMPISFHISSHETYLISLIDTPFFINDLNEAHKKMEVSEFMFQEKTFLKYYPTDYSHNGNITGTDYQLMKFANTYYVGMTDTKSPLAYLNEDDKLVGIYPDLISLLAKEIGIHTELVLLNDLTSQKELDSLSFSFLPFDDKANYSQVQSDPFMELQMVLATKSNSELTEKEKEQQTIGTLSYYNFKSDDISYITSFQTLMEFDSLEELALAFHAGAVDSMFLTSSAFQVLTQTQDTSTILVSPLQFSLNLALTYEEHFPSSKIEIINKFINKLDNTQMNYIISKHYLPESESLTTAELLEKYPIFINYCFAVLGISGLCFSFIERRKKRSIIRTMTIDADTGLYTLFSFEKNMIKYLKKHNNYNFTLISMELDKFHYITEAYGKDISASVVLEFSRYIRKLQPLFACHISDDKFLLFMETGEFEKTLTEKKSLPSHQHLATNYHLTYHAGGYNITNEDISFSSMVTLSQFASSLGRESGENTYFTYTEELEKCQKINQRIINNAETAFKQKEFILLYQPRINLESKEIIGAEALIRWVREDKLVPPSQFLPQFEQNGFMEQLDSYVLHSVCDFISQNRKNNLPCISVNLSTASLKQPEFPQQILQILNQYEVKSHEIALEFTETTADITPTLLQLKELGFSLALDHFSSESTSLLSFSQLNLDFLQFNREFMINTLELEQGEQILKSIVTLAEQWKLKIVAEGIETMEQEDSLKNINCRFAQGYLYHRPLSKEKFLLALKENEVKQEKPSKDSKSKKEEPSKESKNTKEELSKDSKNTKEEPPKESKNKKEEPSIESKNKKEEPSIESKNTKEQPSIDSKNSKEEPSIESKNKKEEPSTDSKNTKEEPSIESKNKKEEPSIDSKNKKEEPSIDSKNKKEEPSKDSKNTKEEPSIDSKNKKEEPSTDSKNKKEEPSKDSKNKKEEPSKDSKNKKEEPSKDSTNKKEELTKPNFGILEEFDP